jgi:hypothetical protein
MEKGERRVKAQELVELASLYGRSLSSLLQGGEPIEGFRQDERLPTRFRTLAVESWQEGDLTEGQLARLLRVNRLQAREIIQAVTTLDQQQQPAAKALGAPLG